MKLKLLDTILLSLSVVALIAGIHQIFVNGFSESYWILMVMMIFYGLFLYRKNIEKPESKSLTGKKNKSGKR